jgi:hypothetical protein
MPWISQPMKATAKVSAVVRMCKFHRHVAARKFALRWKECILPDGNLIGGA